MTNATRKPLLSDTFKVKPAPRTTTQRRKVVQLDYVRKK